MSELKGMFEYYYKTLKHGTFVATRPTEESMKSILELQKMLGIKNPTPEEEIHVTLMYSRRGSPDLHPSSVLRTAQPLSLELYGENKDCLVLVLDSPELEMRHEQLANYGLRHSYDEYSPHVILTYDYQGEDIDNAYLYDYQGESLVKLEFEEEYIEPLDE